jgi:hypothetical protein
MLRMSQQSDPGATKRYYISKAEYYEGGKQELPGRWGGFAADRLGLYGDVAQKAFDAVCLNTVGYDFNFHVPKSVSTWDDQERAWKAGQFRDLKRNAPYYQAAFHARLANRLAVLGYPIERTATGWSDPQIQPAYRADRAPRR